MKKKLFVCLFLLLSIIDGCLLLQYINKTAAVDSGEGYVEQKPIVDKKVALTFDDGPHPYYTEMLLDGLKERGVKATFFLIGKSIDGNEDIVKRMYEEGHLIGNHTYNHVELNKESIIEQCEEITKANNKIFEITGYTPEFMRPPFGAWDKRKECDVEMIPILWSIDPLDWKDQNTNLVVQRILSKVKDGSIILLHDVYKTSVEAALIVVDKLQAEGYEFVTADELILD